MNINLINLLLVVQFVNQTQDYVTVQFAKAEQVSDTIIHVMQQEKREYYALEKLWQITLEKASENR